jgi:hypothetical protein
MVYSMSAHDSVILTKFVRVIGSTYVLDQCIRIRMMERPSNTSYSNVAIGFILYIQVYLILFPIDNV